MANHAPLNVTYQDDGRQWVITWTPESHAPRHANHGALGVCFTGDEIVVVKQKGSSWELPAGRPKLDETPKQTLCREIQEEACCTVRAADCLGTTVSRCVKGPESGAELTRTHWCALVDVDPWVPEHETVARSLVAPSAVMDVLAPADGMRQVLMAVLTRAVERRSLMRDRPL